MAAGSNKKELDILSDILRIAGDYSHKEIESALNHVRTASKGEYKYAMLSILKEVKRLSEIDNSNSAENKDDKPETVNKKEKENIALVREFNAMIEDPEFIVSKKDTVKIIQTYFKGRIKIRSNNKDSKRDLVRKIISEYKKLDAPKMRNVYLSMRRSYLKNRKSHLEDWADIITGGERNPL